MQKFLTLFSMKSFSTNSTIGSTIGSIHFSDHITTSPESIYQKAKMAYLGEAIGDALSMPVHWYYNPNDIVKDYGKIIDYQKPKEKHPSSIMNLSNTGGAGRGGNSGNIIGDVILHGKRKYWGTSSGIHYHQGMNPGENTLNMLTNRILVKSIIKNRVWIPDEFLKDYIQFMTTPNSHNDTYAESWHRMFFVNYSQKKLPPRQCADDDHHNIASMGGFVCLPPVSILTAVQNSSSLSDAIKKAQKATREQVFLTHKSESLAKYAEIYSELLTKVLFDYPLREAVQEAGLKIGLNISQLVSLNLPDTKIIGQRFSSACYITDSFPSLLYLAYKYHDDPEKALIANTNVGGENCHRGSALGALMGLTNPNSFPHRWIDNLFDQSIIQESESFAKIVMEEFIQSRQKRNL